ncbi:flagellar biosynthesis protein FlhF [Heyndrickxia acidicola]|uniref:Flagellar biosynthesis protein FlhF n=1 Tax=Heyndrickxia acidicola TaxID=209389 RepID=A0ABU6MDF0_9BACI|nr:flagellar biosynthesis protein FlhF [Heyndrickxia acidicola]MED1202056.1 flagellar biosynthesis protein FlhF [Heyndrickxia acidicola]
MKVQKFIASNMIEAMKKIRQELGENAVILNSKQISTARMFGLLKKKQIEVIAAVEPQPKMKDVRVKEKRKPLSRTEKKPNVRNQSLTSSVYPADEKELNNQIEELKDMVQKLSEHSSPDEYKYYPIPVQTFLDHLRKQGINGMIMGEINAKLLNDWRSENREKTEQEVYQSGFQHLKELLAGVEYGGSQFQKKFINLVGPTGVGKTTTLAKMAAQAVLEKRKKIAFITTDTYRIAAIEQLKTYSSILNVPVEVVYKREDFQKAIKKFTDYDLVFIDTAGRNYRELQYIEELKKVIDFSQDIETFLTLSLTMKEGDLADIIQSFDDIKVDQFIFTKLDETATYGSMINLIFRNRIGVAYVTDGQDVPDDIQKASAETIVKRLLKGLGV